MHRRSNASYSRPAAVLLAFVLLFITCVSVPFAQGIRLFTLVDKHTGGSIRFGLWGYCLPKSVNGYPPCTMPEIGWTFDNIPTLTGLEETISSQLTGSLLIHPIVTAAVFAIFVFSMTSVLRLSPRHKLTATSRRKSSFDLIPIMLTLTAAVLASIAVIIDAVVIAKVKARVSRASGTAKNMKAYVGAIAWLTFVASIILWIGSIMLFLRRTGRKRSARTSVDDEGTVYDTEASSRKGDSYARSVRSSYAPKPSDYSARSRTASVYNSRDDDGRRSVTSDDKRSQPSGQRGSSNADDEYEDGHSRRKDSGFLAACCPCVRRNRDKDEEDDDIELDTMRGSRSTRATGEYRPSSDDLRRRKSGSSTIVGYDSRSAISDEENGSGADDVSRYSGSRASRDILEDHMSQYSGSRTLSVSDVGAGNSDKDYPSGGRVSERGVGGFVPDERSRSRNTLDVQGSDGAYASAPMSPGGDDYGKSASGYDDGMMADNAGMDRDISDSVYPRGSGYGPENDGNAADDISDRPLEPSGDMSREDFGAEYNSGPRVTSEAALRDRGSGSYGPENDRDMGDYASGGPLGPSGDVSGEGFGAEYDSGPRTSGADLRNSGSYGPENEGDMSGEGFGGGYNSGPRATSEADLRDHGSYGPENEGNAADYISDRPLEPSGDMSRDGLYDSAPRGTSEVDPRDRGSGSYGSENDGNAVDDTSDRPLGDMSGEDLGTGYVSGPRATSEADLRNSGSYGPENEGDVADYISNGPRDPSGDMSRDGSFDPAPARSLEPSGDMSGEDLRAAYGSGPRATSEAALPNSGSYGPENEGDAADYASDGSLEPSGEMSRDDSAPSGTPEADLRDRGSGSNGPENEDDMGHDISDGPLEPSGDMVGEDLGAVSDSGPRATSDADLRDRGSYGPENEGDVADYISNGPRDPSGDMSRDGSFDSAPTRSREPSGDMSEEELGAGYESGPRATSGADQRDRGSHGLEDDGDVADHTSDGPLEPSGDMSGEDLGAGYISGPRATSERDRGSYAPENEGDAEGYISDGPREPSGNMSRDGLYDSAPGRSLEPSSDMSRENLGAVYDSAPGPTSEANLRNSGSYGPENEGDVAEYISNGPRDPSGNMSRDGSFDSAPTKSREPSGYMSGEDLGAAYDSGPRATSEADQEDRGSHGPEIEGDAADHTSDGPLEPSGDMSREDVGAAYDSGPRATSEADQRDRGSYGPENEGDAADYTSNGPRDPSGNMSRDGSFDSAPTRSREPSGYMSEEELGAAYESGARATSEADQQDRGSHGSEDEGDVADHTSDGPLEPSGDMSGEDLGAGYVSGPRATSEIDQRDRGSYGPKNEGDAEGYISDGSREPSGSMGRDGLYDSALGRSLEPSSDMSRENLGAVYDSAPGPTSEADLRNSGSYGPEKEGDMAEYTSNGPRDPSGNMSRDGSFDSAPTRSLEPSGDMSGEDLGAAYDSGPIATSEADLQTRGSYGPENEGDVVEYVSDRPPEPSGGMSRDGLYDSIPSRSPEPSVDMSGEDLGAGYDSGPRATSGADQRDRGTYGPENEGDVVDYISNGPLEPSGDMSRDGSFDSAPTRSLEPSGDTSREDLGAVYDSGPREISEDHMSQYSGSRTLPASDMGSGNSDKDHPGRNTSGVQGTDGSYHSASVSPRGDDYRKSASVYDDGMTDGNAGMDRDISKSVYSRGSRTYGPENEGDAVDNISDRPLEPSRDMSRDDLGARYDSGPRVTSEAHLRDRGSGSYGRENVGDMGDYYSGGPPGPSGDVSGEGFGAEYDSGPRTSGADLRNSGSYGPENEGDMGDYASGGPLEPSGDMSGEGFGGGYNSGPRATSEADLRNQGSYGPENEGDVTEFISDRPLDPSGDMSRDGLYDSVPRGTPEVGRRDRGSGSYGPENVGDMGDYVSDRPLQPSGDMSGEGFGAGYNSGPRTTSEADLRDRGSYGPENEGDAEGYISDGPREHSGSMGREGLYGSAPGRSLEPSDDVSGENLGAVYDSGPRATSEADLRNSGYYGPENEGDVADYISDRPLEPSGDMSREELGAGYSSGPRASSGADLRDHGSFATDLEQPPEAEHHSEPTVADPYISGEPIGSGRETSYVGNEDDFGSGGNRGTLNAVPSEPEMLDDGEHSNELSASGEDGLWTERSSGDLTPGITIHAPTEVYGTDQRSDPLGRTGKAIDVSDDENIPRICEYCGAHIYA